MDAITKFEKSNPDLNWHIAKGKLSPEEPMYGAIILDGETEVGEGESETSAADAFLAAVQDAHLALPTTWRTDEIPKDGTPIYIRVIQPFRYLPYKPNSQQAKRGDKGRWQMMNEYGGWDNCPHPLGNEWCLDPFAA